MKGAAGGVIPLGIVKEAEIVPVAEALPMFPTVTGIVEETPAVKDGILPILIIKSGAGAATTGAGADTGGAVLLGITVSPETGVVTPVN